MEKMSNEPNLNKNEKENKILNNEEALKPSKIFDEIDESNRKKNKTKNKISIFKIYNNENINLSNIIGINNCQKNRYKLKLQNIFFRSKI